MENEVWKVIPSTLGAYSASSLGRVRNNERIVIRPRGNNYTIGQRIKSQSKYKNGYLSVSLWVHGKEKRCLAHRLVAEAFLGEIQGLEINHKNFVKHDNHVQNLEIVSSKQNKEHAKKAGRYKGSRTRGDERSNAVFSSQDVVNILELFKKGVSKFNIVNMYPGHQSAVYLILSGKTWKHLSANYI